MARIVCFGEIMLRLSPPGYQRIAQARSLDIVFGGAEANVAVSLAGYGHKARYVTKLPDNPLGDACRNELRRYGVDVSHIVRGGDRLGVYFVERGASMRPSGVVYDRAGSAIACAAPADFDWDAILEGADWFHFTGITPALGGNLPAITEQACKAARARGITVSCDLNYRRKLWSLERAAEVVGGLMQYVDVAINAADIVDTDRGCFAPGQADYSEQRFRRAAEILADRAGVKTCAFTLRETVSASDNGLSALLCDGTGCHRSQRYGIHIVDRVGGGDAFSAGLIHGLLSEMGPQGAIEFAVAASALKHTIEGDYNLVSEREVLTLAGGDASGRVQR